MPSPVRRAAFTRTASFVDDSLRPYGVTRRFRKCATVPASSHSAIAPFACAPLLMSLTISVGCSLSWHEQAALRPAHVDLDPGPGVRHEIDVRLVLRRRLHAEPGPRPRGMRTRSRSSTLSRAACDRASRLRWPLSSPILAPKVAIADACRWLGSTVERPISTLSGLSRLQPQRSQRCAGIDRGAQCARTRRRVGYQRSAWRRLAAAPPPQ